MNHICGGQVKKSLPQEPLLGKDEDCNLGYALGRLLEEGDQLQVWWHTL
jgi:hypothetical protein